MHIEPAGLNAGRERKSRMADNTPYGERYRPQFHFSARKHWLNDPNGCVFYEGEYHLFFQHNPDGNEWGNMTWGHAVSPDLVHWQQLPHTIAPYGGGTIFSGSAVVDENNSSGLGEGSHPPLVAIFTHARDPYGQAIAYSNDRGRSWKLHADGQHVVPNQGLDSGERDPKVFWHEPSRQWIMVLWVRKQTARFFTSRNLRQWSFASDFVGGAFHECPDLFALPVDGDARNQKWVLHDASFHYWIGTFDGRQFMPETGPLQGDWGANFYAAQTWNNAGPRVVQIAWMSAGQYPGMPFNQQMSFPCRLTLHATSQGIRLRRMPVAEIETLYAEHREISNHALQPGQVLDTGMTGDLFDIRAEVAPDGDAGFSMRLFDRDIVCARGQVTCLGRTAPLALVDGLLQVRLLVDRSSIELFGNGGAISMTSCFLPDRSETTIQCRADAGVVHIRSLTIFRLNSAWKQPE